MNQSLIVWPMIGHALLVLISYLELGRRRFKAAKRGEIKERNFKVVTPQSDSDYTGVAARNVINNFELPVLFHAVCLALLALETVTSFALLLAWVFVGLRYLQALEHLTKNRVLLRGGIFILGVGVVTVLWGNLVFSLLNVG